MWYKLSLEPAPVSGLAVIVNESTGENWFAVACVDLSVVSRTDW